MEPDHVNETPIHDFTLVAAGGDICNGLRGLDDHGQELLAKRGQEECARNCWFARRYFRVRADGHVCSPRSARAGLDPPRNIAAARKPGNVCSSAMEFAIAIAHGVADKHRPPHPPHIGARQDEYLALPQLRDNAMDLWGFKKWRRKLGYTQSVAGEKLGLRRGAVQYWESEIRPVPVAVELAC